MGFSPHTVLAALPDALPIKRYWIALSGGLDSVVLLHALAELRPQLGPMELQAVHIHHGLSHYAAQWAEHCQQMCQRLSVPCQVIEVDAGANGGESPEAAARTARYTAFRELMAEGDCLLTAHHQDDQAETLLLQLLRGAGPKGLAAMPPLTPFHKGWLGRPLLQCSRQDLHTYALSQHLQWVEDESNTDTGYDRNFLRHEIFPRLKKRFPAATKTMSRSARRCAEAAELLAVFATQDLQLAAIQDNALSLGICRELGKVRSQHLLHHWLHEQGLPVPTEAQTEAIWNNVIQASHDSVPLVHWEGAQGQGVEVRRYRDLLYAMPPLPELDVNRVYRWDFTQPLPISAMGELSSTQQTGQGIALAKLEGQDVEVRFRQGGERLRPVGRQETHSLKHLFQDQGIPPWQRDRIPLIYCQGRLAAVVGLWLDEDFAASGNEPGISIEWRPAGAAQRPAANML
jgi:tRNA(Ile)-lysidine synthase